MADENVVVNPPVDNIESEVPQAEPVLGPSTAENQEETERSSDFNKKVEAERELLSRNFGKKPSFTEAQHSLLVKMKKEKDAENEKAAQLAEQKESEDAKKLEEFNNFLAEYEQSKQFAQEQGLPFKPDKEFEEAINARNEQANLARPATDVDRQIAQTPSVEEVKAAEEPIRQENAMIMAEEEAQKKKIQSLAERQKKLQDQIIEEDNELKSIDPDRFWNDKSTGQKVMATIGLILGGIGSGLTGQPNAALQVLQNQIDKDIESQKLNAEQALAKKKHALNIVELNLKRLNDSTNNKLKKIQIQKMISDMQQSQLALQEQRLMAKKLSSSEGLTREEVFALDPKLQEKMIILSDGRFRPATSAQVAKKLNQETIPQAKDSIRGLTELKEILEMPAAEIRPSLRAKSATIRQSLKGALRLELFGPGVMTDFESRMADRIIGDPTKILTLDDVEKAKFNALLKKVKQGTLDKIRQSGVNVPLTKNEKMLNQFMKKNPKIKRPEAINALIKTGFWDESEDIGF